MNVANITIRTLTFVPLDPRILTYYWARKMTLMTWWEEGTAMTKARMMGTTPRYWRSVFLLRVLRCVEASALFSCLRIYIFIKVEAFTQPSRFPAVAENPDDTYVLLVDGVDLSHYNPSLDWSRHLPSTGNVRLDRRTHDRFVLTFRLTSPLFIA